MTNRKYPKTLSELGITLEEYNSMKEYYITPNRKVSADLWFGTCCNRPIHNFVEIAKVRNISATAVRHHIIRVIEGLKEYSDLKHKRKLQQDKRQIEEDIFQISLALFRHYEMPYRSYHCNIPYLDYH